MEGVQVNLRAAPGCSCRYCLRAVMCVYVGRNKWHMAAAYSENAPAAIPLSPEAVETARRAYSAGITSQVLCVFAAAHTMLLAA